MQRAIEAAETGNPIPLETLFNGLKTLFTEHPEHEKLAAKRPARARDKPGRATLSGGS